MIFIVNLVQFRSLHIGFALRNFVNLICRGKYDDTIASEEIVAVCGLKIRIGCQDGLCMNSDADETLTTRRAFLKLGSRPNVSRQSLLGESVTQLEPLLLWSSLIRRN